MHYSDRNDPGIFRNAMKDRYRLQMSLVHYSKSRSVKIAGKKCRFYLVHIHG